MEAALGSHSYGQLSYHLIIVTKYRRPALKGLSDEVKLVLNEIAIENRMRMHAIEVASDHVHMFISVKYTQPLPEAVQRLKGKSSYILFKSHPEIKRMLWGGHLWGRQKFIRSVGSVTEEAIRRYIADSKTHDL